MLIVAKKRESGAFGAKLREYREAVEMTQADLAKAVSVQRISIIRYENGDSEPSWSVVVKLADALGVEPNDFRTS